MAAPSTLPWHTESFHSAKLLHVQIILVLRKLQNDSIIHSIAITGAWEELKALPMNPKGALSRKERELIGLAVASQVPSTNFVYLTSSFAKSNGATDAELRETVANAALVRHWSTFINGSDISLKKFKAETKQT